MSYNRRILLCLLPAALLGAVVAAWAAWRAAPLRPTPTVEVDLKALGNFMFDDVGGRIEDVPMRFRQLDRRRIVVDGVMCAYRDSESRVQFELVYNLSNSHGGRSPPRVQERIIFSVLPSTAAIYDSYTLVHVTGVLHVGVERDPDGFVRSLYRMDVESIVPDTPAVPVAPQPSLRAWHSVLLLPFAPLAALLWSRRAKQRRRMIRIEKGLCPACGYDLRASRRRCPECGAACKAASPAGESPAAGD